jgi:fibronectin type 3 domain-containing protein
VSSFLIGCGYKTSPRPATATIPGEVGLVEAQGYPDKVTLKWHVPASNADGSLLTDTSGFKVYRTAQKVGEECENCDEKKSIYANVDFQNPINAVIDKGEVLYTDKAVTPGNVYSYSVSTYNLKGREGRPSQDLTVVFDEAPGAPQGLRADVDVGGITLEWTTPARAAGVGGYRVYRGSTEKADEMKLISGTKRDETSFVDKDVEKEKAYYYIVRSLKMNRGVSLESEPSPLVKVFVPSVQWKPPENVTTGPPTPDGITIVWDRVIIPGEEVRYNIYRSEAGKMFEKINPEPLRNSKFDDRNVRKGVTYRYAVTSFPEGKPADESRRAASEAVKFSP